MNPETPNNIPILMITMQIPVLDDTNAEQVLEAIGPQLAEALRQVKQHQTEEPDEVNTADDPEAIAQREFNATVLKETLESYSDSTKGDLLAGLGYVAKS